MSPHNDIGPEKQSRRRWFWNIRTRLIVFFTLGFVVVIVTVELAGIVGIPFTPYLGRRGERKAEALRGLDLIAELKKERLYRWIEERCDDAHVCATNEMLEENVTHLRGAAHRFAAAAQSDKEAWQRLREEGEFKQLLRHLKTIKRSYRAYDEIQILDTATRRILVSTDETSVEDDASDQAEDVGSMWSNETYLDPVILTGKSSTPILHFNHVIHKREFGYDTIEEQEDQPIAVLVMKVLTDDIIKNMLHTGAGLGKSGEALLVDNEGRILTTLKHSLADGRVPRPLQHKITAEPASLAARGEEGIIDSRDYRGKPVVAAYRHIRIAPESGWGLVVKRDKSELLAPLRADMGYTLVLGSIGAIAFVGLAVILAGSLTRPIRSLSQTAERVSAGDLSLRAPVTTSDEVGLLATTFNTMVDRVEKWQTELRDQVRARTIDLRKTNESLTLEIAERKLAEEASRESEERFKRIFESASDALHLIEDGKFVASNEKALDMYGCKSQEEMLGLTPMDISPERQPDGQLSSEKALKYVEKALEGQPQRFYWKHKRRDTGELRHVEVSLSRILSRGKQYLLGIGRDTTEVKRAEREREELIAKLEAQNAELERYTYTVSHDLKSPLITIKGYIGLLAEDLEGAGGESVEDDLARISNVADKMDVLLRDLLELSRIGRLVNPPEDVPLGELVGEAIELVGEQIKRTAARIEIAPDLPVVFGDRLRLSEVMQNLIDNAVKYMGDQSHSRVEIGSRRDGDETVCYVRDNGIGIEPRYQDKVFELFDQLDQKVEGSGIGLALVKRIVEIHGGRVWIESEGVGHGSTFCFAIADKDPDGE